MLFRSKEIFKKLPYVQNLRQVKKRGFNTSGIRTFSDVGRDDDSRRRYIYIRLCGVLCGTGPTISWVQQSANWFIDNIALVLGP